MKRKKFLCVGLLPILICSLILLAITAGLEARDIERKVKESAIASLNDEQLSWAKVETYNFGRKVLITGSAPNEGAIDKVLAQVKLASGVLNAKHNGEALAPPPLTAPTLDMSISDKIIKLSGTLSSQDDIDLVIDRTERAFGNRKIENSLTLSENVTALNNADFISAFSLIGSTPSDIGAELNQQTLKLSGSVTELSISEKIEDRLKDIFTGPIENSLSVAPDPCGTVVNDLLASQKINFDTGKAVIGSSSYPLLTNISNAVSNCADNNYEVGGHSDSTGNADFNLKLSEQRAQAVVNHLVEQGLPREQFRARGYGASVPIGDNDTAEGRAQNRRIEFTLSD